MSRYKTFQQLPLISLGVVHKLYWEARGKARVHEQTNNSTTKSEKKKRGGGTRHTPLSGRVAIMAPSIPSSHKGMRDSSPRWGNCFFRGFFQTQKHVFFSVFGPASVFFRGGRFFFSAAGASLY